MAAAEFSKFAGILSAALSQHHLSGFQIALLDFLVTQSCPSLCNTMDYSPPGSSAHGIFQARILEWVAIPSPGDLPDPGTGFGSPTLQADSLPSEPLIFVSYYEKMFLYF